MRLLVAEDDLTTRLVMSRTLEKWGYEVEVVDNGEAALAVLTGDDPPRVAILDWMMPKCDGVAVCQGLQTVEGPLIYTILLTAKNQTEDLVYALENGAHDFHTKPVNTAVLRSRIEVGRRLIESDDKLQQYANHMERLAEERAKALVHSDRLAMLGTLSAGIAHEIKNPVTFISCSAEIIASRWPTLANCVAACTAANPVDEADIKKALNDINACLKHIDEGARRVTEIVKTMKGFSRRSEEGLKPVNLNDCVHNALELCHNAMHRVNVEADLAEKLSEFSGNPQQIEQVLVNLFVNARDAMEPEGGTLAVTTRALPSAVGIVVEDSGTGIPAPVLERIWDPFFTTKDAEKGTGLGMSISKGIVEEHGGSIAVSNRDEGGARFTLSFPLGPVETPAERITRETFRPLQGK